jgi:hypothetical protein
LIVTSVLFTGCANQVLYGTWQLAEVIDAETMQPEDQSGDMFFNLMAFTINRDKTVTFLDSEFGTFTKSRNEFVFTYATIGEEEKTTQSGAWELIGGDLYIYVDDAPLIYHFVRVEMNEN